MTAPLSRKEKKRRAQERLDAKDAAFAASIGAMRPAAGKIRIAVLGDSITRPTGEPSRTILFEETDIPDDRLHIAIHVAPGPGFEEAMEKIKSAGLYGLGWEWLPLRGEQGEWAPPPEPAQTSLEILKKAADHQEARAIAYDSPGGERSMARTVQVFNLVSRRDTPEQNPLSESEGWMFMQFLKDVRDRSTVHPHRDSLEDKVSYASLAAEARLKEQRSL